MNENLNKIYRICDANFNRAKEGLRVVEDYFRFFAENNDIMQEIRDIRHNLGKIIDKELLKKFVYERDVFKDAGMSIKEESREKVENILIANIKRVQEALRVLEEYFKIISNDKSKMFKDLRFRVYNLEKGILKNDKEYNSKL